MSFYFEFDSPACYKKINAKNINNTKNHQKSNKIIQFVYAFNPKNSAIWDNGLDNPCQIMVKKFGVHYNLTH